jgi:hypothetical protein
VHPHPAPQTTHPEPFDPPRRGRMGVVAVVGGAAIAAILIVAAGIALLRAQGNANTEAAATPSEFSGGITCTLDREASQGSQGVADMSFTASGSLCVNERTLYAPLDGGSQYRRVIVLGEARALDILTIDTSTGEFRRERYPLDDESFASANQAVSESSVGRGCEGNPDAVSRRNQTLMQFAEGDPSQRLVWRCEARN